MNLLGKEDQSLLKKLIKNEEMHMRDERVFREDHTSTPEDCNSSTVLD